MRAAYMREIVSAWTTFLFLCPLLIHLFFLHYSFRSSSHDVADTCFNHWASKKLVPFSRHHPLLTLSYKCQHEVDQMTEKQTGCLQPGLCHSPDLFHTTTMKETTRVCVAMKRIKYKICTVQTFYGGCKLPAETKLGPAHPLTSPGLCNSDCWQRHVEVVKCEHTDIGV